MTSAVVLPSRRLLRLFCLALAWLIAVATARAAGPEAPVEALRSKHTSLAEQLAHNAFQRPIVLESTQTSDSLKGDIYAVVDHDFGTMKTQLSQADHWCDVLILHLNVKHCVASGPADGRRLTVTLGKKVEQELKDAYQVEFNYKLGAATSDYLQVMLSAEEGPLGTRDYRIMMEAMPLDAGHSFMHMTYSYGFGMAAKIALQSYLATLGSGKVGFSVVGKDADGKPQYADNVRGLVERNTMRYYLAIETYLDSTSAPPAQRQEKRLKDWFAATERYPLQLHEIEESDYLAMKHNELQRQAASASAASR